MKYLKTITLAISVTISATIIAQEVRNVSPLSFEADIIEDFTSIVSGGIDQNELDYLGQIDFCFDLDLKKLGLWKGASLFAHIQNTHGAAPSGDYVGDLQAYTNIEAGPHTGFFEFYYSQNIGILNLRTGWHDLNSDFYWTEFGGLFINSSFGIMPGVSMNVPVSIFPTTAPFVYISAQPNDKIRIQYATYGGSPGDPERNPYNLKWNLSKDNGMMTICELEYINDAESYFGFKVGGYAHAADFQSYSDTLQKYKSNFGMYAIVDKNLIAPNGKFEKGLDSFIQIDFGPSNRNITNLYLGTGLSYHGFIKSDNKSDMVGIALAHLRTSKYWQDVVNTRQKHETVIELTYQVNFDERFYVQPDLQYIINPGAGANGELNDALAATIRIVLAY